MKVAAKSNPGSVAVAIAGVFEKKDKVELQGKVKKLTGSRSIIVN